MTLATEAEADREWARNVGAENPERAWILSDRDCWYRNPAYSGPPVPHPEDYVSDEEAQAILAECEACGGAEQSSVAAQATPADGDPWGDDLPF